MPIRQGKKGSPADPAVVRRHVGLCHAILSHYDEEWWALGLSMKQAKELLAASGVDTSLFNFKIAAATACRKWLTGDPKSRALADGKNFSGREWSAMEKWARDRLGCWRFEEHSPAFVAQSMRQSGVKSNAHGARETMKFLDLPFTEFTEHPDVEASKKTVPVAEGNGTPDH